MKFEELQGKKIFIVGAGKEGKATMAFLQKVVPSAAISIVDQINGSDYLNDVKKYDVVIKSPGVKPSVLTVSYTTAINIFFANVKGITIGVTGTKGKSTTASLLYAILRQAGKKVHLVGNIGNPALTELAKVNGEDDIWVCELSSFMTADMQYSPNISVILNLFPEHMDYHGTTKAYYAAKKNILEYATENGYFVYNPEVEALVKLAKNTRAKTVPFIHKLQFPEKTILLPGNHNRINVRAAVTVANILNIPDRDIEKTVKNFKPLHHRLENIGTFNGITFYDDAISTTPQSAMQAIETVKNIGTIFLGGQDRGYDFSELAQKILDVKIPNLVLFPDSGERILKALQKKSKKLPIIFFANNTKDGVLFAYKYTKPGAACVMSPASPSYSLWKNFEERGNEFQKEVKRLAI